MHDTAVVDVDDLYCEDQITRWLVPLHDAVPSLVVTAYTIPNKLGPVHALRDLYPWLVFAIHGHEHSQFETRAWTDLLASRYIDLALEMGYAPLFKAPNWLEEPVLEEVCAALSVVLHHHDTYTPKAVNLRAFPGPPGKSTFESVHTHIVRNPSTDFIEGHAKFTPAYLAQFAHFSTPLDLAVTLS